MELTVVFLNLVLFVAVGYALVVGVLAVTDSSTSDLEKRVANLEGQVAALREKLRERDE